MDKRACSDGHAICKDLGSSFSSKKAFPLKKSNPNAKICAICLNNLACNAPNNKKNSELVILLWSPVILVIRSIIIIATAQIAE